MPDRAAPRARYAVGELLHGLGLAPAWTDEASTTLYVGTRPEASAASVRLRVRPEALLDAGIADAARIGWLHHVGRRWPLPVGPGGERAPVAGEVVEAAVVESAFWWLAGVQEAATTARDRHGRVRFADALQARLDVRDTPAVDGYRRWRADARRARGGAVPGRTGGGSHRAGALTHDVDALSTRRGRAFVGEMLRGRPAEAFSRGFGADARRESVLALADLARRHGTRSTFFWKGGATAPEDVAYRLDAALLARLAADGFEGGLHPSYHAHGHSARLADERDRVARAAGGRRVGVRAHFVRGSEPAPPAPDEAAGLRLDSTLGWSEAPGFRRGTAAPFRLYSLADERATDLWEMPLAVMDTTLFTHLALPDDEAAARVADVFAAARAVGGCAVVLWHPAMDGDPAWARRLDVLDHAVGQARAEGARIGPLHTLCTAWNVDPALG